MLSIINFNFDLIGLYGIFINVAIKSDTVFALIFLFLFSFMITQFNCQKQGGFYF